MTTVTIDRPFRTPFVIETNCPDLLPLLILKFGQRHVTPNVRPCSQTVSVWKQGDLFEIAFDGKAYTATDPLHEVERLLFTYSNYDDSIFALHGAAVAQNNHAFLFLASTQGGKTTLTS